MKFASSSSKPFIDFKNKSFAAELGIGIFKGLFNRAGKYQRTRGGDHLQTPPSDRGEFRLRDGPERPFGMDHAQPCAPRWRVGGGDRRSIGSGDGIGIRVRWSCVTPEGLGCPPKLVEALQIAPAAIDDTHSVECVVLELRVVLQAMGEIGGTVTNEDILYSVFREFYIGK